MNSKIANAQHAKVSSGEVVSHKTLKSRLGASLVAGALALSVCPVAALAMPGDGGAAPQGDAPAMQQGGDFQPGMQGGAPSWQDASTEGQWQGEAPSGSCDGGSAPQWNGSEQGQQPQGAAQGGQPSSSAFDEQVREALSNQYGVDVQAPGAQTQGSAPEGATSDATPGQAPSGQPGQMGDPADAPELPEGAINVQQVIDALRDVFGHYSISDLEANIGDESFVASLQDYAVTSNNDRLTMFASNQLPSDRMAPTTEDGESTEAPAQPAVFNDEVSGDLMSQVMGAIMGAFGYTA